MQVVHLHACHDVHRILGHVRGVCYHVLVDRLVFLVFVFLDLPFLSRALAIVVVLVSLALWWWWWFPGCWFFFPFPVEVGFETDGTECANVVAMPPARRVLGIPLRSSVIRTIAVFVSFPIVVRKLKIQNRNTTEEEEKEKKERETKERERSLRLELQELQKRLEIEQKKQKSLRRKMLELQKDMRENKDKVNREDYERLETEAQELKARVDRLHEIHAARRSESINHRGKEDKEGAVLGTIDRHAQSNTMSQEPIAGTSTPDEVERAHHRVDAETNPSDPKEVQKDDANETSMLPNGTDNEEASAPGEEKDGRRGLLGRFFRCAACTPVRH